MKHLKTFEEQTYNGAMKNMYEVEPEFTQPYETREDEVEDLKFEIDNMSHEEMASLWRFGDSSNKYLQGEVGEYFKDRLFNHFGGFNPSLSKRIGW